MNLAGTTSPSGEHMCHTDSQEYLEQVNSVFLEHESPEEERNSEVQTYTQSETTEPEVVLESTSRILDDEHETTKPEVVLEPICRIFDDEHETTEPEVALESTSRILDDEHETTEPEVVLETKKVRKT